MNDRMTRWLQRRPSLHVATAVLWAARAFLGWVVALPIARVVASSGLAARDNGDGAFFEPGGFWLFELVREFRAPLGGSLEASLCLAGLAAVFLTVPSAFLFVASASPEVPTRAALRRAVGIAPQFLLLGVVESVLGLLLVGVAAMVGGAVSSSLAERTSEPNADLIFLAFALVGMLLAAGVALLADVTRGALAAEPSRLARAVRGALGTVERATGRLVGGYGLACGASWLTIAAAARLAELCRVDSGRPLALLGVGLVHQIALLTLVLAEAFWARRIARVSSRSDG